MGGQACFFWGELKCFFFYEVVVLNMIVLTTYPYLAKLKSQQPYFGILFLFDF